MTTSAETPTTDLHPERGRWPVAFRTAFDSMLLARAEHVAGGPRPLVLGGYPAKKCARAAHNTWDPTVPPPADPDLALQARFDLGVTFEAEVIDLMRQRFSALGIDMVCIDAATEQPGSTAGQVRATLDAMVAGASVIAGGRLPDVEGRTGMPDLLLRVDSPNRVRGDGPPFTYVPGDIKAHKIAGSDHGPRKKHHASLLADPSMLIEVAGYSLSGNYRKDDGMQLAHYTRMLQALDAHPGSDWERGFIVGTNNYTGWVPQAPDESLCLTWIDLADPYMTVWAQPVQGAPGKEKVSLLTHYDREFDHRLRVAHAATTQGTPGALLPLVHPVGKSECGQCGYQDWCRDNARAEDEASWRIAKGKLSDREWAYLTERGYGTVEMLAEAPAGAVGGIPADPAFLAGYRCAAAPLPAPDKRIAEAVRRARLIRDGIIMEWTGAADMSDDIAVRDIEIDFDIEWDPTGHIYLWGVRMRRTSAATFAYHAEFGGCATPNATPAGHCETHRPGEYVTTYEAIHDLDDSTHEPLLERVAACFDSAIAVAERYGLSLGIYHWSHPERSQVGKIDPALRDRLVPYMIDLRKTVEGVFFDRDGTSVKVVAPAFGFTWRQDDAGGAMSQIHYETACTGTPEEAQAAVEWLCSYNGDDCEATAVIRDALRAHAAGENVTESDREAAFHTAAAVRTAIH